MSKDEDIFLPETWYIYYKYCNKYYLICLFFGLTCSYNLTYLLPNKYLTIECVDTFSFLM